MAIDSRQPRDGRVIEELGSYDPMIKNTDARVKLTPDRIKYWMSVGAKPSENVEVLIKKYMAKIEQEAAGAAATTPTTQEAVSPEASTAWGELKNMRFDVLTLFPDLFQGYLTQSLLKLAIQNGLVQINLWNIRDWATGKHHQVDDRPFGGGPGMVLMVEPLFAAVEAVQAKHAEPGQLILLTPAGERLTQPLVRELSQHKRLLLLCGRYEGFDDRVRLGLKPREVSIGEFVCNGGEVAAMVMIDTVIRYVPGVLGDPESVTEESHSDPGQLEYPQYTRPRCSVTWPCLKCC